RNRLALEHQLERGLRADQARKALRPARTRQQTELDLGQPDLRTWASDAIVAPECQFEPAAQRVAVDRGHIHLRAAFDPRDHVAYRLRPFGPPYAELVDVRAAAEDLVGSAKDDGPNRGIR